MNPPKKTIICVVLFALIFSMLNLSPLLLEKAEATPFLQRDGINSVKKGNLFVSSDNALYENYINGSCEITTTGDLHLEKNYLEESAWGVSGDFIVYDRGTPLPPQSSLEYINGTATFNFKEVAVTEDGESVDIRIYLSNCKIKNFEPTDSMYGYDRSKFSFAGFAHSNYSGSMRSFYFATRYYTEFNMNISFYKDGIPFDGSISAISRDLDQPPRLFDSIGNLYEKWNNTGQYYESIEFINGFSDFHVEPNTWLTTNGNTVYSSANTTAGDNNLNTDISYIISNNSNAIMKGSFCGSSIFTFFKSNLEDFEKVEIEEKKKIIKFEEDSPDGDEQPSFTFDYTSWDDEKIFKDAPEDGIYKGKTPPTVLDYTKEFKVTIKVVREIKTTKYKIVYITDAEGKTIQKVNKEIKITYESDPPYTITTNVNYRGYPTNVNQTKYRPLNVNRNNYAEVGDGGLGIDFVSGELINGSVDNLQNITDNTPISALDINNDSRFNVNFNNEIFGLPDRYDWLTKPEDMDNFTWEYVTSDDYANGRFGDMNDITDGGSVGYYRYNLKGNASITSDDLASLIFDKEEKVGLDSFEWLGNNGFVGGEFSARFILNGTYYTDSLYDSSNLPYYWKAMYNQERFFEYGVEYKGVYTVDGFQEPELVANKKDPQPSRNQFTFITDGLTQRGLYVGSIKNTYYQPLVMAHWNVKTLAGNLF